MPDEKKPNRYITKARQVITQNRVAKKMSTATKNDLTKLGIGTAVVGGVAFLGYEAIQAFTGTVGGSCSQTGTPCYECMSAYQKELGYLTVQFNAYYSSIMTADAAANSGITEEQQNIINNYQSEMNTQITGIQNCAKQYSPTTWESVAGGIVTAIVIIAVGVALAKIIQSMKSYKQPPQNRNGGGGGWISNMLMLANLQNLLNQGKITPENAASLSGSASSLASIQENSINSFTQTMVTEELITQEEAAAIAAAMTAAVAEETATIIAILAA